MITSAQAAARLLAERLPPGAPVLVVGGIGLRAAVRERGLRPVTVASDRPAAVVQGYSPGLGYADLAEGALAVAAGAWYVASNADATLPTPRGRQPGNGSLIQVIVTATGRSPVVAGKPEPPLHAEAVARSGARHPLVVGDRLDTDIESAVRSGADSLLVLTGVTSPLDVVLAAAAAAADVPGRRAGRAARPASGSHRHPGWVPVRRVAGATGGPRRHRSVRIWCGHGRPARTLRHSLVRARPQRRAGGGRPRGAAPAKPARTSWLATRFGWPEPPRPG